MPRGARIVSSQGVPTIVSPTVCGPSAQVGAALARGRQRREQEQRDDRPYDRTSRIEQAMLPGRGDSHSATQGGLAGACLGGKLQVVLERRRARGVCRSGARGRGRSADRPARRSWGVAARAGRCRSGCRAALPRSRPCRCCHDPFTTRPSGVASGAEVGAAAVVLEAGERAVGRRRGRLRSRHCRSGAGPARGPSPGRQGRARAASPRRVGSCGRATDSRRRRRGRRRYPRLPSSARRAWSSTMSAATMRWSRSWPPPM